MGDPIRRAKSLKQLSCTSPRDASLEQIVDLESGEVVPPEAKPMHLTH